KDFQASQDTKHLPCELVVHGLLDVDVAGTHDLRSSEVADQADEQSGDGGLEILRPARESFQSWRKPADPTGKNDGAGTTGDAENTEGKQLLRAKDGKGRDAKHGGGPEKRTHHDNTGDRGKNDGTEDAGTPAADNFLDDEENGGN